MKPKRISVAERFRRQMDLLTGDKRPIPWSVGASMAHESITQEGWSDTVENQCHLLNAICSEILVCEIKSLCEWEKLSEEEGWSLFGLETVKQVLEEGAVWDQMFSVLFAMDLEYRKDVTKHFKRLKEDHQATIEFLRDLRQSPRISKYQPVFDFLSYWN